MYTMIFGSKTEAPVLKTVADSDGGIFSILMKVLSLLVSMKIQVSVRLCTVVCMGKSIPACMDRESLYHDIKGRGASVKLEVAVLTETMMGFSWFNVSIHSEGTMKNLEHNVGSSNYHKLRIQPLHMYLNLDWDTITKDVAKYITRTKPGPEGMDVRQKTSTRLFTICRLHMRIDNVLTLSLSLRLSGSNSIHTQMPALGTSVPCWLALSMWLLMYVYSVH